MQSIEQILKKLIVIVDQMVTGPFKWFNVHAANNGFILIVFSAWNSPYILVIGTYYIF